MKLRYKVKREKGVVDNKLTGDFEKYKEIKNVEPEDCICMIVYNA